MLSLAVLALFFLTAELFQRTVVVALISSRPPWRRGVLTWWVRVVATTVVGVVRFVGGVRAQLLASIPARAGTLILMNHQSLLDIPIAVVSVEDGYPVIVTRERYRKGYPLVSHMIRLYGYPTVRPGEHAASQLESLRKAAAGAEGPLLIYPEGTRSRDGAVRPFKTAGLHAILEVGPWSVYLLVVDGLMKTAGISDYMRNITSATIRVESVGPFSYDGSSEDAEKFIAFMRARMIEKLAEMRACAPVG